MFGKKQFELSTRWLERSLDVLDRQELENLSDDAGELRLAIMQLLGTWISPHKTSLTVAKPKHSWL